MTLVGNDPQAMTSPDDGLSENSDASQGPTATTEEETSPARANNDSRTNENDDDGSVVWHSAETHLSSSSRHLSRSSNSIDSETRRDLHWRESVWAVGKVDVTWAESRRRRGMTASSSSSSSFLGPSAWICPLVCADRVGNMAVLYQSTHTTQQVVKHDDNGTTEQIIIQRPQLHCVVGPYWIVPALLTYPVIVILTFLTARKVMVQHIAVVVIWSILTSILIASLSFVACRNPGIMYRRREEEDDNWRWSDQALTFRPPHAKYDPECAVVIEGFDHTCPWTGTAIGKRNMIAFRVFLGSVLVCLIFDVVLLTNPFS